ncbi:DUF2066 domain-containing protein [Teredinibacter turnerae]|uniref:DUF2066 domain-containing protein n=1 Tax=Teredinibacter turnerae TaxID=2426 RepID=UPI00036EB2D1|nr:DUF2066 domain-containing protein [Teredinibacter turnerae]
MALHTRYNAVWNKIFILLTGACFLSFAAQAAEQNYFQAEVAVESQSTAARKQAAETALAEVLVRMSGTMQVLDNPVISKTLPNAISYVEQFQYAPNTNQIQRFDGYNEVLSLEFSPAAVERLLRQEAGMPFWPTNRPGTLVWLVEDSASYGRQLLGPDDIPAVFASLNMAAQRRGLPLNFPLMDLEDQLALSADQVWELDETAILSASERYGADVILVGRYSSTSSGRILATWQFFHRDETQVYDSRAEDLAELGGQALDPLADYLGARYAITNAPGETKALVMQLEGVSDFKSYRGAVGYLENLALTTKVVLAAVRNDTLLLHLSSDAGVDKFISTLALDSKLVPVSALAASEEVPVWMQIPKGTAQNPLIYRWR